ncbi:hypothetical protein CEXT_628461 [Caerostris extrusa]|uniref:Uncharacterized protein n=1 Tax=Caerostris extrusa TaxID=172846 RepID=A0AAV4W8R7_CAEEX|nr:hypothetical protein CEXT_628461 [Caerostris extrusa]
MPFGSSPCISSTKCLTETQAKNLWSASDMGIFAGCSGFEASEGCKFLIPYCGSDDCCKCIDLYSFFLQMVGLEKENLKLQDYMDSGFDHSTGEIFQQLTSRHSLFFDASQEKALLR